MPFGVPNFLGENSVIPQFGEGGVEGLKTQNLLLFKPINIKSETITYQKNRPIRSIRGWGEYGDSPPFWSKKSTVLPISSPNLAEKLKLGVYI